VIKKLGCNYFPLQLDLAIHSKPAYLAYDKMVELYSLKVNKPSGIKLYSSSCYLPVPIREKAVANSIAKAFCDTVDFPRLVNKVYNDGGRIFIETGPRHTCSLWIEQILKGKKYLIVPLNVKGVRDQISIAKAVSMLISHKVNMNIECLYKFLA
jgi:PfaB family protein